MQSITTLSEFFQRTGADVRLFDMGRRVAPFEFSRLTEFEAGSAPWPLPWNGQARMACAFRLGSDIASEPLIWFLALPLDEQGMLVPGPRDAFLERLIETLGRTVDSVGRDEAPHIDNLMRDNPLAFTPELTQQAMLHAQAARDFAQSTSKHHALADAYLLDADASVNWQMLGLQGIADLIVRLDSTQEARLAERIPALPVEVLKPLCYCMEHCDLASACVPPLRERAEQAARSGDLDTLCAVIRALGGSRDSRVGAWYDTLLDDPAACGPDVLAAMAARGWTHLEDAQRLPTFLNRLAENPQANFTALVRDLALVPRLRLPVLMTLRQANADSPIGQRLAELDR
ncbi:uncharacterized protein DUF3549 [Chromohalobacter marismortui]|uniref:Uncharacterized protein DUF3549 n=1 Tax=Chromohalobacter marismortui TaxID=42055 RepID=A0A4R7NUQ9_9GAMM|nr:MULTISPECIES: DUF3549 family protein [Chromohalobacter]MCI0510666.1 DUF3549 family protein [Chromohalobacter sp.]MCI0592159.1 DUF3549 family protein [Chromohalobacter sp.]TDU24757.1 uncharacterized protein DUF3549 [Chromohalobacter marismortui]